MLAPHAIAIAPRIGVRFAPPPLEPIAIAERELSDWPLKCRTETQSLFMLLLAIGRLGFTMKIKFVQRYVLRKLVIEAGSPALVDGSAEVPSEAPGCLQKKIELFRHRNRKLHVVP